MYPGCKGKSNKDLMTFNVHKVKYFSLLVRNKKFYFKVHEEGRFGRVEAFMDKSMKCHKILIEGFPKLSKKRGSFQDIN